MQGRSQNPSTRLLLGSVFGRTDFFADFYFGAAVFFRGFFRDLLKALETTTAMKGRKISCIFCSDSAVSDLSLHGRCISRSLQNSARVVISQLLACNCCSLAVVVSAIFASQ